MTDCCVKTQEVYGDTEPVNRTILERLAAHAEQLAEVQGRLAGVLSSLEGCSPKQDSYQPQPASSHAYGLLAECDIVAGSLDQAGRLAKIVGG